MHTRSAREDPRVGGATRAVGWRGEWPHRGSGDGERFSHYVVFSVSSVFFSTFSPLWWMCAEALDSDDISELQKGSSFLFPFSDSLSVCPFLLFAITVAEGGGRRAEGGAEYYYFSLWLNPFSLQPPRVFQLFQLVSVCF